MAVTTLQVVPRQRATDKPLTLVVLHPKGGVGRSTTVWHLGAELALRGRGYEMIAGHRRLEAARRLGWTEIAAVLRDESDDQAYILTLVENLQREDLQPKEEAAALEVLVRDRAAGPTRQVGEAIKRSHIYVSRRLRVFDDPALAPLVLQNSGQYLPRSCCAHRTSKLVNAWPTTPPRRTGRRPRRDKQ